MRLRLRKFNYTTEENVLPRGAGLPRCTRCSHFVERRKRQGNFPVLNGHAATRPPPQELPVSQPEKFLIKVEHEGSATLLANRSAPVLPEGESANREKKTPEFSLRAPVTVHEKLNPEGSETMGNESPESLRYWTGNENMRCSLDLSTVWATRVRDNAQSVESLSGGQYPPPPAPFKILHGPRQTEGHQR